MRDLRKKALLCGMLLFLCSTFSNFVYAQVLTKKSNVPINGNCNGYLEWLPQGYNPNGTTKYPLIFYMNGMGSTGNGSDAELENHFSGGGFIHEQQRAGQWPDSFQVNGVWHKFIVITPQFITPYWQRAPTSEEVNSVLNYMIQNYKIDTTRIYLAGNSSGGGPVWDYISHSSQYANRIAAAIPFCGTAFPTEEKANIIKYANVPVWGMHNQFDPGVPVKFTLDWVEWINSNPAPNPPAKLYTPPDQGHGVWYMPLTRQYTENGMNIYQWFLTHKRTATKVFAGNDVQITPPTNTAQLNGAGTGPNGTTSFFSWTKVSGPSGGNLSSTSTWNPSVSSLVPGTYRYRLTVTDNTGASNHDEVVVHVNPITVRIQAENWTNMFGVQAVGTTDEGGGQAVGYIDQNDWMDYQFNIPAAGTYKVRFRVGSFYSGGVLELRNAAGQTLTTVDVYSLGSWDAMLTLQRNITLPAGVQTLRVVATSNVAWNFNWLEIVTGSSTTPPPPPPNVAPTAQAGGDQTITLPTNSVTLNGSGADSDGTIASYQWSQISGPNTANLSNATAATTGASNLVAGTYTFRLTVTDNGGLTGQDDVVITVNPAPNVAPTANAGNDVTITLPTNSVNLSGSGADSDGSIASYLWTKISGPSGGTFSNANIANPTLSDLSQGSYVFRLTVTDNSGATANDDVTVNVNAAPNTPPTANAGADQNITLPTSAVTLNGSGADANGTITGYAWTQLSGPNTASIQSAGSASTTISGLTQGSYVFRLTVTDNNGATASDEVTVNVAAAPNQAPSSNAGPDQNITLPTSSVSLAGSGSDNDGSITGYLWTQVSGPNTANIQSPNAATTTVSGLVQGSYTFRLRVTDNNGATSTDEVTVNVAAAPNTAPSSNAGADQTITLPTNSVTLNGSGTDADGSITGYLWTQVSGPTTATINSANSASTVVSNLSQGSYVFRLRVTDNVGATSTDDVTVNVGAAPNTPPTANAGPDKSTALPNNSVLVSGSGTDANGSIVAYLWSQVSGPNTATINNPNDASTVIGNLVQGTYTFRLRVTDNQGANATDDMVVTVTGAVNSAPVVSAGPDKTITAPNNFVDLDGSATDPNNNIQHVEWFQLSGPTTAGYSNKTAAITNVSNLVAGVYVFRLTATDTQGLSSSDEVTVTVNAAPNTSPTANAGTDKTITLPTNSVGMNGGGTDPDGSIASYSWSQVSGPSTATITNGNTATATVGNLSAGTYVFRLTVTDNSGASASDDVQVTVNPAPPTTGTTRIEAENWTAMQGVQLEGTADAGGGQNVGWIDIGDWMDYTITTPAAGSYTMKFRVTSPNGNAKFDVKSASGTVLSTVTVPNTGGWQSWTTIEKVVTLQGGTQVIRLQSLADGYNINWIEINTGSSTPSNTPPVANAGADKTITLPTNEVLIYGSGTDANGTVVWYSWTQVSGPSTATINNPNDAATVFSNLQQGSYTFRLTVGDNGGATGSDDVVVLVNGNNPPPSGNTVRIEAENWTAMQGVQLEGTPDVGGGQNVGWIDNGDWMEYTINPSANGTYTMRFRIATEMSGAQFQVRKPDGTVITTVDVPNTGGWQSWQTISKTVSLTAGLQVIRLISTSGSSWNINWIEIEGGSGTPPPPPPPPTTSTRIEAEHYTNMSGIQTEGTSDAGGGQNVGYIDMNDWMEYSVTTSAAGTYTVNFRLAAQFAGGQLQVRKPDGTVLATVNVPGTGWWQTWQTVSAPVALQAGTQTIRIVSVNTTNWNINWIEIVQPVGSRNAPQVDVVAELQPAKIEIYPNPVLDRFTLDLSHVEEGNLRLQVVDMNGRVHRTFSAPKTTRSVKIPVALGNLPQGSYILQIQGKDIKESRRFIKMY